MFPDSSGGPGPSPLIATRFVWPHGGTTVCLVGSFSRWQDMTPMSSMEGCPLLFQVVCNLSPGYYQFNFFVDGELRYDDQQPFVKDESGNFNNVVLVKEAEAVDLPQTIEVGGQGAVMEVDSVISAQGVPSAVPHQSLQGEGTLNISPADVDMSRERISEFLLCHTAYELLPESGKVVVLDVSLAVKQAFHVLFEQGVPVAPLWDSDKQQFVGMLTASDFITILQQIGRNDAVLSEEELDAHTIAAWKYQKTVLAGHGHRLLGHPQRPLVYVGPDDSMREVTMRLMQHRVATVPVLHFAVQEPTHQILHLASLSGVLKCFWRHFRHAANTVPLLSHPISSLRIGTWIPEIGQANSRALVVLHANDLLSDALNLLMQAGVSALPIVDDKGSLLDIYARSDITALARDRAYARVPLDKLTVAEALQIGQTASISASGSVVGPRLCMCLRTDSLHNVIERLSFPGVRRLICVEAGSKRVEGVISLSDIFNLLLV